MSANQCIANHHCSGPIQTAPHGNSKPPLPSDPKVVHYKFPTNLMELQGSWSVCVARGSQDLESIRLPRVHSGVPPEWALREMASSEGRPLTRTARFIVSELRQNPLNQSRHSGSTFPKGCLRRDAAFAAPIRDNNRQTVLSYKPIADW